MHTDAQVFVTRSEAIILYYLAQAIAPGLVTLRGIYYLARRLNRNLSGPRC